MSIYPLSFFRLSSTALKNSFIVCEVTASGGVMHKMSYMRFISFLMYDALYHFPA